MNPIESSSKSQLFSHFARVPKALASPVRLELLEALARVARKARPSED
jgi:hypothetical protein